MTFEVPTPFEALGMGQGEIKTWISPAGGWPAEFWRDRAMDRIMSIADSAPQPIRDQAIAFKAEIGAVVLHAIVQAVNERRAYDAVAAEKFSEQAAQAVRATGD